MPLHAGIPCQAYHAGRPAKERSQVLDNWNTGKLPVVAATIAFGMGIDRASRPLCCPVCLIAFIGLNTQMDMAGLLCYMESNVYCFDAQTSMQDRSNARQVQTMCQLIHLVQRSVILTA